MGVRQAKAGLSKLIEAALNGEQVIITNHGRPLVEVIPAKARPAKNRGRGCLKGQVILEPGWDSQETDEEIAARFEHLQELPE